MILGRNQPAHLKSWLAFLRLDECACVPVQSPQKKEVIFEIHALEKVSSFFLANGRAS
jgi:hypothetical protein